MWGASINIWWVAVLLLVEDESPKLLEHWPEGVKFVGASMIYI